MLRTWYRASPSRTPLLFPLHLCSFLDVHWPFLAGSIPQLTEIRGVIRRYFPFPKIPVCSTSSAFPRTFMPRTVHGSTDTRSSTTSETRAFPLVMFLYL